MTMAFDTLRYSQRLQQSGVGREQAEAHAELARDMIIADLATKADLATVMEATKADLATAVKDVQSEIKLSEQRITIRLGAMIAGAVAIIVAVQKVF